MLLNERKKILLADPKLAPLVQNITLPDRAKSQDLFHALVRSITGQQLSVKVAKTIYSRFIELYKNQTIEPSLVMATDHETLRSIGYSNQKARYIRAVAEFFLDKPIDFPSWSAKSDSEIIKELTSIKGVGKWTSQMILMFSLDRTDILPVDDYGIQVAMKKIYHIQKEGKALKTKMLEIAEKWRPERTLACLYLWASLENTPS